MVSQDDDRIWIEDAVGAMRTCASVTWQDSGGNDSREGLFSDLSTLTRQPVRVGCDAEVDARQGASSRATRRQVFDGDIEFLAAAGSSGVMVGRFAFDQFVPEVKLTLMPSLVVSSTTM